MKLPAAFLVPCAAPLGRSGGCAQALAPGPSPGAPAAALRTPPSPPASPGPAASAPWAPAPHARPFGALEKPGHDAARRLLGLPIPLGRKACSSRGRRGPLGRALPEPSGFPSRPRDPQSPCFVHRQRALPPSGWRAGPRLRAPQLCPTLGDAAQPPRGPGRTSRSSPPVLPLLLLLPRRSGPARGPACG